MKAILLNIGVRVLRAECYKRGREEGASLRDAQAGLRLDKAGN